MEGGRKPILCRWLSDTTREAHSTSRGGSSPNSQPPAPPPGPLPPHLHPSVSPRDTAVTAAAGPQPLPDPKEHLLGERPAASSGAAPGRCCRACSFRRHLLKRAKGRSLGRFARSCCPRDSASNGQKAEGPPGPAEPQGRDPCWGGGRLPRAEDASGPSVLAGILSGHRAPSLARGPAGNQACSQVRGPASRHLQVRPHASLRRPELREWPLGGVTTCGRSVWGTGTWAHTRSADALLQTHPSETPPPGTHADCARCSYFLPSAPIRTPQMDTR